LTTNHPTIGFWSEQFLLQIHCPVSLNNRVTLAAWIKAENTKAKWNPLATTKTWPDALDFNSSHVKNYLTFSDGIQATAATIRLPYYTRVVELLHASARPVDIVKHIASSPWGTKQFDVAGSLANLDAISLEKLP
jgi:hypothetical protein